MCFCSASQNISEVKLCFRQEDLLSKLMDIGLVFQLERQTIVDRKKLLFLFHVIDMEVTIDNVLLSSSLNKRLANNIMQIPIQTIVPECFSF